MRTVLLPRILINTLSCIAAGFISGLVIASLLALVVILFTANAHADIQNTDSEHNELRISNPADVNRGSLLFKNQGYFSQAPTLNTDVTIDITGMIARATVKQYFKNPDADWKEGIYVFPLPEDAAVDHMRLKIGLRTIEGQIKEKQEARKTYEKARKEGKKASLLEQERPNIFTTSVTNIGPNEEIIIEIEYQQTVRYDAGTFRLRFPMVVAPRYIPGNTVIEGFAGTGWAINTDQVPDASRITPHVLHPDSGKINPVSLKISLDAGFTLPRIESPYHNINIKQEKHSLYKITLHEENIPADRDFELTWRPDTHNAPQAALFTEQKEGETYALIMMLPPDQAQNKTLKREIIFVIDTSGSMSGSSIVQAKSALDLALSRLKPEDSFNIIQFNNFTYQLFQHSQVVSTQSLQHASQYVNSLQAQGGTEMAPALRAALAQSENQHDVRQVVFLTDGSIGNEDELFKIIKQQLGNSRLFTVGIGSAPNSHFMNRAASFGRGTHTYIGKVTEVQEKMSTLFRKLENPVLTDIRVNWANENVEDWPDKIPDLYLGEPLLITAKANTLPPNINISGKVAGSPWNASLGLSGGQNKTGVSVLWARKKIAGLMSQINANENTKAIRQQIIDTALSYHLVSKYTSLVAVDVTPVRVQEEILKTRALPVNLPAGWEYEKVFGQRPIPAMTTGQRPMPAITTGQLPVTATPAQLNLITGLLLLLTGLLILLTRRYVFNV